jgi:glycosyltransferase involved in cell wall biosynthesis
MRFCKNEDFSVVHIHTERANFYYGLISKLLGVPVIIRTIHNCFSFKGILRYRRIIQRWALRLLGVRHVSISPSVKSTETEYFSNPTIMIQNWYDRETYYPPTIHEKHLSREELKISAEKFVLLSVGNCSPIKNHSIIINAISQMEDRNILYLHVGIEEDNHSEKALSETLGVRHQIRFLGYLAEIRPYLWAADVFVMPSLYEGVGIAALEAIAAGLPCILADVPGLRNFKGKSSNLFYIEPNEASLTTAIQDIRHNYPAALVAGNEMDLSEWDVQKNVMEYYELYRQEFS